MRALNPRPRVLLAILLLGTSAAAQEGYPLDGTWRGSWQRADTEKVTVVVVMKWDGETINGIVNPGPSSYTFSKARLDADDWSVHIEAESADGRAISINGTLEEIGAYNRRINGTLTEDGTVHPFSLQRE